MSTMVTSTVCQVDYLKLTALSVIAIIINLIYKLRNSIQRCGVTCSKSHEIKVSVPGIKPRHVDPLSVLLRTTIC